MVHSVVRYKLPEHYLKVDMKLTKLCETSEGTYAGIENYATTVSLASYNKCQT